jgi:hypothetical protein
MLLTVANLGVILRAGITIQAFCSKTTGNLEGGED